MGHVHESLLDGVVGIVFRAVLGWGIIMFGYKGGVVIARMKNSRFDAVAVTLMAVAVCVIFLCGASGGTEDEPSRPLALKEAIALAILLGVPALCAAWTGRLRSQLTDAERAEDDRKDRESRREGW